MINIGDKVVCVKDDEIPDWMWAVRDGLKNFVLPNVGEVYTVRDIRTGIVNPPNSKPVIWTGIKLVEISAGIDKYDSEWWYDIESFRKAIDAPLQQEEMLVDA